VSSRNVQERGRSLCVGVRVTQQGGHGDRERNLSLLLGRRKQHWRSGGKGERWEKATMRRGGRGKDGTAESCLKVTIVRKEEHLN